MSLSNVVVSSVLQLAVLGGIPSLVYYVYHRVRFDRNLREVAVRLGLCVGRTQFILYGLAAAVGIVIALVATRGSLEPFFREGLAQRQFVGVGVTPQSIAAALFYGGLQTGLTEELLFRGLIAGSLARRLPSFWANLAQAAVFMLPHLPILFVAPELWGMLLAVFAVALLLGWMRIQSGSILGPWLVHASVNVTVALIAASQWAV